MMLSHDLALTVIIFTWSERWELRVTPRILGLYGKGDGAPPLPQGDIRVKAGLVGVER